MKILLRRFPILLLSMSLMQVYGQTPNVNTGPKKSWVENISFDKSAMPPEDQKNSYYYLLVDEQENFAEQESYTHYAYKILANEGVQQMSDLRFEFDPAYEKLTLHSLVIHRNGVVINKLPKVVRTLHREESMDRFLYDGSLTADINLTDVRTGDIVEYAVTRKGYNPIYEHYINRALYFNHGYPYEKGFQKIIASDPDNLTFKKVNTTREPEVKRANGKISYEWNTTRLSAVIRDKYEPDWFDPYEHVLISNFKDWHEVAAWANKHYEISDADKQIVLRDIVPQFKGATKEEFALQAIRFVQDEVRYLGFESGLNSHKPHPSLQVYNQRFGDCKDKSFLLVNILRAKGLTAYPLLLNTDDRGQISQGLPSATAFDHCVVQLKLGDRTVYVDATTSDQGGKADSIYFPPYGKGLVVNPEINDLVDIPVPRTSRVTEMQTFDLDSLGGPAILTIQTTYTGDEADGQRSYFSRTNKEAVQKRYLNFYGDQYSDMEALEKIKTTDDREADSFVVTEKYKIPAFWKRESANKDNITCEFYPLSLETYFSVSKSSQRHSPYALTYPLSFHHTIHVNSPQDLNVSNESDHIKNDRYDYRYSLKHSGKKMTISTDYETKDSSIPIKDFSTFVKDHERMMNNLSYKLTYNTAFTAYSTNIWPGVILSVITFGLAVWLVIWLYTNYDPKPHYPPAWAQPIGGWLILPAIGMALSPFYYLYTFYSYPNILNGVVWVNMFVTKRYGVSFIGFMEQIVNVGLFVFSLLLMALFFKRRSSLPRLISILYGVSLINQLLDAVATSQINTDEAIDSKSLVRSVIAAAIWIPYFYRSNRVKKTFVFTRYDDGEEGSAVVVPVSGVD